jgi:hypothetical protein
VRFRLVYMGRVPSRASGGGVGAAKQRIREELSPQIARLWERPPLSDNATLLRDTPHNPDPADDAYCSLRHRIGDSDFVAIVSSRIRLVGELDILILRPSRPGSLFGHGGDLDNRTKTILDSLRLPSEAELTQNPATDPTALTYVLLEDDALVTRLNVEVDQLLAPSSPDDVMVVITVNVCRTRMIWANSFF